MAFLLPYQFEYFNHNGNLIYEKSRQIGISWAAAFKTVVRSMEPSQISHYVAQDQKSSKGFIEYCVEFLEMLKIPDNLYSATAERVIFANKSAINALTSNAKQLRGRRGVVVLDEFAFHDSQDDLLAAAQPVATWGGWIEIISTHNGPFSTFSTMLNDARTEKTAYKVFKTDIYEAIEQGLVEKINKKSNQNVTREDFLVTLKNNVTGFTFAQEYECKVADESSYIVNQKQYHAAKKPVTDELTDGEDLYIGVDIGRSKNWTVIWIIDKTWKNNAEFYDTKAVKILKDVPLSEQIDCIAKYMKNCNVNKVFIDKGLFGLSIYEELYDEFGSLVEGKTINRNYQKDLCEKVRKAFEFKSISVPDDDKIMADVCSMAQVYKRGSVGYGGGIDESHADAFYALALALDASGGEEPYISIGGIDGGIE